MDSQMQYADAARGPFTRTIEILEEKNTPSNSEGIPSESALISYHRRSRSKGLESKSQIRESSNTIRRCSYKFSSSIVTQPIPHMGACHL